MFLGKTVVHGLYALCYFNRMGTGVVVTSGEVASAMGIPQEQARKVMMALAGAGWITSARGRSGGYFLSGSLHHITMLDLLDVLQPRAGLSALQSRHCPFTPQSSCSVQNGIIALREQVRALFARKSVRSMIGELCCDPAHPHEQMSLMP